MPVKSITDARFQALQAKGYTGTTNDKILQWLRANGATAKNIPDAWTQFLAARGFGGTKKRGDQQYAWLGSLAGMTTSKQISDRWLYFWNNFSTYFP